MGIEEDNVVISMTDTLDFGAKILFNGNYFDCETQFTVKDVTVGSVVDGAFVPAQEGTTEVVVKGVWNGIQTLPVTVSVSVINTVEISLKESGSGTEVEKISLCTYDSFDGKEYQTQFLPVIEVVENGVQVYQFPVTVNAGTLSSTPTVNTNGNRNSYTLILTAYDANGNFSEFETSYTPSSVLLQSGDLDGDTKVTESDAFLAFLAAAGKMQLSEVQLVAADSDQNGFITAYDARVLYRRAAGLQ
jgi:hypothetical protein